jgi:hypothetical protein
MNDTTENLTLTAPPSQILIDITQLAADATEFGFTKHLLREYFNAQQSVNWTHQYDLWFVQVGGFNYRPGFLTFHEMLAWLLDGGAARFLSEKKAARDE